MVNFGYPYNDLVICKDSTDYLEFVLDLIWAILTYDQAWLFNGTPTQNYPVITVTYDCDILHMS